MRGEISKSGYNYSIFSTWGVFLFHSNSWLRENVKWFFFRFESQVGADDIYIPHVT